MAAAWDRASHRPDIWHHDRLNDIKNWLKLWGRHDGLKIHRNTPPPAFDGQKPLVRNHPHFDNELTVVSNTLERIRASALQQPVTNLSGFWG